MVAAVASVGGGSAAGGKSVNAQIAALQKQFGEMQKQMMGLQKQMTETTDRETRRSLQLQVQSVSAQMQMIQQQIAMLRSQDAANAVKNAPALESPKAAAQEAGGKQRDLMLGGLVDTRA
jgi:predicted  nucleic acid-binding Zn-ribbon protein